MPIKPRRKIDAQAKKVMSHMKSQLKPLAVVKSMKTWTKYADEIKKQQARGNPAVRRGGGGR